MQDLDAKVVARLNPVAAADLEDPWIWSDSTRMHVYLEQFEQTRSARNGSFWKAQMEHASTSYPWNSRLGAWKKRWAYSQYGSGGTAGIGTIHMRMAQAHPVYERYGKVSYFSMSYQYKIRDAEFILGDYDLDLGQGLMSWTGWQNPCRSIPECLYLEGRGSIPHTGYYAWSHLRGLSGSFDLPGTTKAALGWSAPRMIRRSSSLTWSTVQKSWTNGQIQVSGIFGKQLLRIKTKSVVPGPETAHLVMNIQGHKSWNNTFWFGEWVWAARKGPLGHIVGMLLHLGPELRSGIRWRYSMDHVYSTMGQRSGERDLEDITSSGIVDLEWTPGYKMQHRILLEHGKEGTIHGHSDFPLLWHEIGWSSQKESGRDRWMFQIRYRLRERPLSGSVQGLRTLYLQPEWRMQWSWRTETTAGPSQSLNVLARYAHGSGMVPFMVKLERKLRWGSLGIRPFVRLYDEFRINPGLKWSLEQYNPAQETHAVWYTSSGMGNGGMQVLRGRGMLWGTQILVPRSWYRLLIGLGMDLRDNRPYMLYSDHEANLPLLNMYLGIQSR